MENIEYDEDGLPSARQIQIWEEEAYENPVPEEENSNDEPKDTWSYTEYVLRQVGHPTYWGDHPLEEESK